MNILNTVQEKLRDGSLKMNPSECVELKAQLCGEYSWLMSQLEDVLLEKPKHWNSKRSDFKSDTATDRWWDGTQLGIDEMGLRSRVKRCERLIGGLASLIKRHENEAKNLY